MLGSIVSKHTFTTILAFAYFGIALANALRILDERVKQPLSSFITFGAIGVNWLIILGFYLNQLLSKGRFNL